jgi:transcription elongation factor GreA
LSQNPSPTLAEAQEQYLRTLKGKAWQDARQAVSKFVDWYASYSTVADLRPPDIGNYADESARAAGFDTSRLAPVRQFLAYLYKSGLTETNLSTHLKPSQMKRRPQRTASENKPLKKMYITQEGLAQRHTKLEELKERRLEVIKDIETAMADKDFRENAPLDAAKEEQAWIEAQIRELEQEIAHAEVEERPEQKQASLKVKRNSKVILHNTSTSAHVSYTLVEPREANPSSGKISINSPVGQALLGRSPSEEILITVPGGSVRFRIEKVEN